MAQINTVLGVLNVCLWLVFLAIVVREGIWWRNQAREARRELRQLEAELEEERRKITSA